MENILSPHGKRCVSPLVHPSDDGCSVAALLDGQPEVERLGEVAFVPDVGHEDGLPVHIIYIGALCAEGFLGGHIVVARGFADEGGGVLCPWSPDAFGTEHTGFVGCPTCATRADEPVGVA